MPIYDLSLSISLYNIPLPSSKLLRSHHNSFQPNKQSIYFKIREHKKPHFTNMGFPVGYTEILLPRLFFNTLSILGFLRTTLLRLLRLLGLSDFLEQPETTTTLWHPDPVPVPDTSHHVSVSASLIRELLPVVKYSDVVADTIHDGTEISESCAVCLYEFEADEEIRRLRNCRHIFHRSCLDRWMDHDQKTCPLCRMMFVPDELMEDFNQRLWAATGILDFYDA
ncbi:hypothetical protein Droror1_Dr00005399 [Drosera rotundifolia]